ncbi:MAG: translation initiation factor IF-2 [Acidimicrobiia bacterium]|nr:translation initiation factor IF-2 [Acidimicrobiia bacterium]MYB78779.1 translation initiation factor IF-2 [Acidimicrobiia bacterium]
MARVRIYQIARELDLSSHDVIRQATEIGLAVRAASSTISTEEAELVRFALVGEPETDPEPVPAPEPEPEPVEEASAPSEPVEDPPIAEAEPPPPVEEMAVVEVQDTVSVAEYAEALDVPVGDVVARMIGMGRVVAAGQQMPKDLMVELGETFGALVEVIETEPERIPVVRLRDVPADDPKDLVQRPPIVTVMGHVDHGKTTLLDAFRRTDVVSEEAGGITQHIGAYQATVEGSPITFIDTPGHEAFTTLRARGAELTDIVVLVIAADDGVMPQTVEAVSHARAAGVEMLVAINKIDRPGADPMAVRTKLTEHSVIVEELGGDVPSVEISATEGDGLEELLETIDLMAQIQELKASPKPLASGVVVDSRLDRGMGPVATVIVQRGTLKRGDALVAGGVSGRVRAMFNHAGQKVSSAAPSSPVLVMGWNEPPGAGDGFEVVKNERLARQLAAEQADRDRERKIRTEMPTARDRFVSHIEQMQSTQGELRLVVKADAHGSVETLREAIGKIKRDEGRIEIVHAAVGGVNLNDVNLSHVTGAVIVGFNVRAESKAAREAQQRGIEVRSYSVIYELLDDVEQLLVGRLAPERHEDILGVAEVRALFRVPRAMAAGCLVTEGRMAAGAEVRLYRDDVVVYTGSIASLRRFKQDVDEVVFGLECGIVLERFNDVKDGDLIEAFTVREVART